VQGSPSNPIIHLSRSQPQVPRLVSNPKPLRIEPTLDFNPIDEDVDLSDFINKNIRFGDSKHSRVNPFPRTNVANSTNIKGLLRGGNQQENLEREREKKKRREREIERRRSRGTKAT